MAAGYDMDGNSIWNTVMSTTGYEKSISENSTGFYHGQNIIAWVNNSRGNLYGQNIGWDGSMGGIPTTSVPESVEEEIISITKVYTIYGQLLPNTNLENLRRGVYIVQGLNKDGKPVTRKLLVE